MRFHIFSGLFISKAAFAVLTAGTAYYGGMRADFDTEPGHVAFSSEPFHAGVPLPEIF